MPYHPSLEKMLDTPEIRKIKKLDLREQRENFKSLSISQIKRIPRTDILEEDIKLENNTVLRHYKSKKPNGKAPEHKYPTAVEHALFAYDWLYQNISNFNIDPQNIFVMGDIANYE